MRAFPFHRASNAPNNGEAMQPLSNLVGIKVSLDGPAGEPVSAEFSVMGGVTGHPRPNAIEFGGSSIISLAGTSFADWGENVVNQNYTDLWVDLISIGSSLMSFSSTGIEAEER